MTVVLGLDLSLAATGIALIHNHEVTLHTVRSKGKKDDTYALTHARTVDMRQRILPHLVTSSGLFPELAVIEAPSYNSRFGKPHDRAGLWWWVFDTLVRSQVPVATVSPNGRAKYISGSGTAKKDVVLAHAIERYVGRNVKSIGNDNEADALGLAAMGARKLGFPIEQVSMPDANLGAMGGAKWPT